MKLEDKVYRKLISVPPGKITTYSELAKSVGLKNGQRQIGHIMKNNPFPVIVPCHRVVKSNGTIGGYAFGIRIKANMLSNEGIKISRGKILDYKKMMFYF